MKLSYTQNDFSASCYLRSGNVVVCAEASYMLAGNCWWIARVLVNPPEARRKGYGTKVLSELLARLPADQRVIVAPGGYGSDIDRLRQFYMRFEFEVCEKHDGVLERLPEPPDDSFGPTKAKVADRFEECSESP
jgi:GNAT superfamily N-acetyltransferase